MISLDLTWVNLEPSKLVLWGFDHPPDSIIYYFNLSLTHLPVCQRFSPPFGLYSFIHIIPNYSTLSKQNKQLHTTQQSFLCGPYYLLCQCQYVFLSLRISVQFPKMLTIIGVLSMSKMGWTDWVFRFYIIRNKSIYR